MAAYPSCAISLSCTDNCKARFSLFFLLWSKGVYVALVTSSFWAERVSPTLTSSFNWHFCLLQNLTSIQDKFSNYKFSISYNSKKKNEFIKMLEKLVLFLMFSSLVMHLLELGHGGYYNPPLALEPARIYSLDKYIFFCGSLFI